MTRFNTFVTVYIILDVLNSGITALRLHDMQVDMGILTMLYFGISEQLLNIGVLV